MIALTFPLLLLLISLPLLYLGWRGRVVGSQPVCRKCGFDLTGLPETSTNCPECGSDLRRPNATRRGHLLRRRGMLWTGGILLFMGLAFGGLLGIVGAHDANFNPYKPLWMLVREVGSSDPTVSQPAMREISGRMANGQIADEKIRQLADAALELQGNPKRPWEPAWGDFIETARANGKLTDAQWLRYSKQAPDMSIEVRPVQERLTGNLPYWIVMNTARVGTGSRFHAQLQSKNQTVWVSGIQLPAENGYSSTTGGLNSSGTSKSGRGADLTPLFGKLKDGPQTLRVKGTLELLDATVPSGAPPLFSFPFDLTANWTLQTSGASIKLKKDESQRPAVERAISIETLRLRDWTNRDSRYLDVNLNVKNLPVSIAFDIIARLGDHEWKVGRVATPASAQQHDRGFGTGGEVKGFTGDRVDIILRPSTEAAAATTDTFEVWDGVIEFKNVKVEMPPAPPNTAK